MFFLFRPWKKVIKRTVDMEISLWYERLEPS